MNTRDVTLRFWLRRNTMAAEWPWLPSVRHGPPAAASRRCSMFGFLRKVFDPTPVGFPDRSTRVFSSRDIRPGEAEALANFAASALDPPSDLHSDAGWDVFWRARIE